MEQTIAPKELEMQLLAEEALAHPGWEETVDSDGAGEAYAAREEAEWQEADLILCGSEFVKEGIRACGGPVDRIAVVPYGVDIPQTLREPWETREPLRVLTVGAVGLRKGSPYVLSAARALRGRAIFRMVGNLFVAASAERSLREHTEVIGPVRRGEVVSHYAWADVFLLPSICEGSATVCYEALACGLPVITTPNAGSPIRDGTDGFVVPIRDPEAIAERVGRLAATPDLLAFMSRNALERSREFTVQRYGERLLLALGSDRRRAA
jgi:glycosyltransferase involved in cell wall biosynthesis